MPAELDSHGSHLLTPLGNVAQPAKKLVVSVGQVTRLELALVLQRVCSGYC